MNKLQLESRIINSRPEDAGKSEFVKSTMTSIKKQSTNETFFKVLRNTNVTKQGAFKMKYEKLKWKFKQLPAYAMVLVILATISTIGVGAYAAVNWFGTDVKTEEKNNVVTVSNKDCPNRISNSSLGDWKPLSDSETTYKILKPELVSPKDIKNSHLITCERSAVDALTAKYFPAEFDFNSFSKDTREKDGLYQPFSNFGTVDSVSDNSVVIRDIHVNNSPYPADYITTTLSVLPTTRIINQGQPVDLASLRAGDQVYFIFQDKVGPNNQKKIELDTPGKDGSVVLLIAKTQYDYRLMDDLIRNGINGGYEVNKTNDPNAGG